MLLAGFASAILCLVFFLARPLAIQGKFPACFSDHEKREISSLVRWDAYKQSVRSLRHGQLRRTWNWIVNARKQEVYATGNQPDGQIWVHVGVKDKSASEGYYLSARLPNEGREGRMENYNPVLNPNNQQNHRLE